VTQAVQPRSPTRAVAIGGAATVVCLLPAFLTGGLATFIQADLHFTAAGLGIAVALFRAAGAASSPLLGRTADRVGATRSLRIATGISSIAALGIALTANSTFVLTAWLMLAGCCLALVQPAANRMIAGRVSIADLGKAFGVKQSAPPLASMLAGVSVPVIAATVGWRWAFAAAAMLALFMTVGVRPVKRPNTAPTNVETPSGRPGRKTVLTLATTFGMGTACSSVVTTFFVVAMVDRGTQDVAAGTLLALGSLLAVVTRVVAGVVADHYERNHLKGCAALAFVGALGLAALASADTVPLQAAALIVALVGTWGFNGVFWYALIRTFPQAPGRVTGSIAPGALLGSTVGPIVFGFVAEDVGYTIGFQIMAVVAVVTAIGLLVGNRLLSSYELATST
jgi:MFS family permease